MDAFDSALRDWTAIVGAAHVSVEPAVLDAAGTATFATGSRVHAIIRPGSRQEVQACVGVANRTRTPIYPISTGMNWGYGSRVPVRDGVVLDLGRLNRILELNEELAYVTLEPGVTQRQLYDFLHQRESRLWMDATGASPDCSVIGNALERGFGHTPMGDHCSNVCAFEVVLPDGTTVETGFARFPGTAGGALGRWGLGPAVDGLFSQANMGIVTRMSVWLMPRPECFQAFFFVCREEDGLERIVDALRPLRLNGTLRSVLHIGNDYKVLAGAGQFPWKETNGRTPLDRHTMRRLRRELSIGAWNGSGALYGTAPQVREARRMLRRALGGKVARLQFVNDRLLNVMMRFARPFRLVTGWDVSRTIKVIGPVFGLLKGAPTAATLASAYWRKQAPPPAPERMNPDADGCGLLWCVPVLPNTGADANAVASLTTDVMLDHGFEPQMSFSLVTERSAVCITTISYDREARGEDERAMTCYRTLTEQLLSRGYPPYRLNIAAMDWLGQDCSYARMIRALKGALDPQGILAPGRYDGGSFAP